MRKKVIYFKDMCSFIINETWHKLKAKDSAMQWMKVSIASAAARLIAAKISEWPGSIDK